MARLRAQILFLLCIFGIPTAASAQGHVAKPDECIRAVAIRNTSGNELTVTITGEGVYQIAKIPTGEHAVEISGAKCINVAIAGTLTLGAKPAATSSRHSSPSSIYDYAARLKACNQAPTYTPVTPSMPQTMTANASDIAAGVATSSAASYEAERAKRAAASTSTSSSTSSSSSTSQNVCIHGKPLGECCNQAAPASPAPSTSTPSSPEPTTSAPTTPRVTIPTGPVVATPNPEPTSTTPGGIKFIERRDFCVTTVVKNAWIKINNGVFVAPVGGACVATVCACKLKDCACKEPMACGGQSHSAYGLDVDGVHKLVHLCGPSEPPKCKCGFRECVCATDNACGGKSNSAYGVDADGVHRLVHICGGPPVKATCEEGAWRWKVGGARKVCSFDAPRSPRPRITLNPQIPRGEHAVAGARDALGDLANTISTVSTLKTLIQVHGNATSGEGVGGADAISLWGNVAGDAAGVDIPTSPDELFTALASNELRMGQKMVEAGDRWAQAHARKMVNLVAEVDIMHITLTCKEIETCRNHVWVSSFWPEGRQVETLKETLRMEVPDILIGEGASGQSELNRAKGRVETWLRQIRFHQMLAQKSHLENNVEDPCSACNDAQGGGTASTPDGEREAAARRADCERLRRMLQDAELELNSDRISKNEYDQRLTQAEQGLRDLAPSCDNDLRAARSEEDDARTAWRTAIRRLGDMERHAGITSGPAHTAAEAKESDAKLRLDRATAHTTEIRTSCDGRKLGFEAEINMCRSNLVGLNAAIPPLELRVADLRRNLESCERGR